jgi:hypothetical protein
MEVLAGNDLAGALRQGCEDAHDLWIELDPSSGAGHFAGLRVDPQVAKAKCTADCRAGHGLGFTW